MDKRLAKRHKRQVARAKEKAKVSEPDVRTAEEVAAAKAISRPDLRRESHPWPTLPSDKEGAEAEKPEEGAEAGAEAEKTTEAEKVSAGETAAPAPVETKP